jgi:hypothetical protein
MKKHYQMEEHRLLTKNRGTALIRLQCERLLNDIDNVVVRDKSDQFNYGFHQIKKLRDMLGNKVQGHPNLASEVHNLNSRLDDVELIAAHMDSTYDDVTSHQEATFTCESSSGYYKVSTKILQGVPHVFLEPSALRSHFKPGKVNFKKFVIKKEGEEQILCYRRTGDEDYNVIGYYLQILGATFNLDHYNKELAVLKLQAARASYKERFIASFKTIHYRTLNMSKSIIKWIYQKLSSLVADSVWIACLTMTSIGIMFASLHAVGRILAPIPAAYDARGGKGRIMQAPVGVPTPATKIMDADQEINIAKHSTYKGVLDGRVTATMVGISGSVFLVNKHFSDFITGNMPLEVYDPKFGINGDQARKTYYVGREDVRIIKNSDAALLYINGFRPVRNCLKHFVTEYDLKDQFVNFRYGRANTILLRVGREHEWRSTGYQEYSTAHTYDIGAKNPHERVVFFKSPEKLERGDSGSLAFHDNPKIPNKIMGIFLAINGPDIGYIGLLSKEQIEEALLTFPIQNRIETACSEATPIREDHELKGVFKYNDEVYCGPHGNLGVSKSSGFRKSPIHEVFPVETTPAIQDIRDPRIPEGARHFLEVSLNKTNGEHEPQFTKAEEKMMMKHLEYVLVKYTPGLPSVRLYDTRQAIIGIRAMGSTTMNFKSSAGLPYKLEKGVVGKSPFIKFHEETKTYQIQERVFHDVEYYESMYSVGKVPHNHKLEFRKKELVGDNKIINPKTRTVATGNMIHQICYNKIFKDLYTLHKNAWELGQSSPFALGVDPERHWHKITEHLRYLDYVVDFDVKAWEEKVSLRLLNMTTTAKLNLIKSAYRSRNERLPPIDSIAYGIAVDFTDAEVCFEDVMYRKRSGLLSGHPGTFMENSEIHEMILFLAVYRIIKKYKPDWANIATIEEHVRSVKAADDIIIAVSPAFRAVVTVDALVIEYNKLGFELTSADKSADIRPKNIYEVQFLKNKFVRNNEGLFQCCPNKAIVYQLMNWVRDDSSLSREEQFLTNVENAFRFAFWQGEEFYEDTRSKYNDAAMKIHHMWTFDYEHMRAIIEQHRIDVSEENARLNSQGRVEGEDILDLYLGDD